MVSRYLVDGIVIAGLLAGTLGVFYLSMGFFGKHRVSYLRPLLPAVTLPGLLMLLVISHPTLEHTRTRCLLTLCAPVSAPATRQSQVAGLVVIGLSTYLLAYTLQFLRPDVAGSHFRVVEILWAVVIVIGGLTSFTFVLFLFGNSFVAAIVGATYFAGLYVALAALVLGSIRLSEEQLKVIGLILTFVGIATQFLPPILDLLNISVK